MGETCKYTYAAACFPPVTLALDAAAQHNLSAIPSIFSRTATTAMRRTPQQAQQTRDSLLRAALNVFERRGVARASLAEIAAEAGVTRGALYWHFKNREELFDALFQHLLSEFSQQLDDDIRRAAPDMLGTLRQALLANVERLMHDETQRKFCRVLHLKCEHTSDNAAIAALMQSYKRIWHERMHAALLLCQRQGALPPDLDTTAATLYLNSLLFGFMHLWLMQPEHIALPGHATCVIDAALDALRTSAALRRSTLAAP